MKSEAKVLLDQGLRFYNIQEYGQALEALKAGYQIDPRPEFLYALGQTYRLRGDCKNAIDAYKSFLRTAPPVDQSQRTRAQIDKCESKLDMESKARSTETPVQSIPPVAQPAPAPPVSIASAPGPRSPWYTDWVGGALCGAGLASAVVGFLILHSGNDELDSANQNHDMFARFQMDPSLRDSAENKQTIGAVMLAGGGALIVAGVVRYLVRAPGNQPSNRDVVSLTPLRNGGIASLQGRF